MAKWTAPGAVPVIISRLDGHSIWVGTDPVEAPERFESELLALGAVRVDAEKRRARRAPKPELPLEPYPEPEAGPDDAR